MSFLASKPSLPPETPPVPQPDDPEVKAQKKKTEDAARARKGLGQTVKTGGLGVTGAPTVERKTLLG